MAVHSNGTDLPEQPLHPAYRPSFTIIPVRTPSDLTTTIILFEAYAKSLNLDLSFQDFQTEMNNMPGKYSRSAGGELLLARSNSTDDDDGGGERDPDAVKKKGEPLGCVALRSLQFDMAGPSPGVCEMKRLYVLPTARGLGLGKALAREIIVVAGSLGYSEMRLDTLPTMNAAQAMYKDLGFVDIDPYRFNPVEGTRYLGLKLNVHAERRPEPEG